MMSGDLPPAYLVFTTGNGFAPNIEGIPQAMKGLGTMFMLALLTGKLSFRLRIKRAYFLEISPWRDMRRQFEGGACNLDLTSADDPP